jgi:hypothetical protein
MGKLYRRKGSEDKLIVVATDEEYSLAKERFKHRIIIKTGVGSINVIKKLKNLPKWIKITNFGYVGSNVIPIGTELTIDYCGLWHPNVDYKEKIYKLKNKQDNIYKNVCFTSNDFVTKCNIKEPCVFDMELAYICALGFKRVESIKIVSDNLSLKEYEGNVNGK